MKWLYATIGLLATSLSLVAWIYLRDRDTNWRSPESRLVVQYGTAISAKGALPSPYRSPFRFFSPTSFWNEPLTVGARLAPNSAAAVSAFAEEVVKDIEAKKGLFINTTAWSVPIYTVPADQPKVKVMLEDPRRAPGGFALQSAWNAVPLPANARPAAGTDKHLVVWQPKTDRLWEFWRLERVGAG